MSTFDLAAIRQDFPITEKSVYVNHAAVGPLPMSVQTAMLERMHLHMVEAEAAWDLAMPSYDEGRRLAAKLVNSQPEQIAYIQNTSHGISLIASGLLWQAGDNVVVPDREFPSNYYAWKQLEAQGVELRHVPVVDGRISAEQISSLVDANTRVVTLSQVQFFNGFQCDVAAIGAVCQANGALFVVDGTQSIGAIQLDVAAAAVDVLVVSAHKWMMGPLGIGFMALSEAALQQIAVTSVGWLSIRDPFNFRKEIELLPDARRFEPGTENGVGMYGLLARLRSIDQIGAATIEKRVLALTDQLCDGVQQHGYQVTSPRNAGEKSAIVTFRHPTHASEALMAQLRAANVSASLRQGGIRISPHYYNSEEELDTIIDLLR